MEGGRAEHTVHAREGGTGSPPPSAADLQQRSLSLSLSSRCAWVGGLEERVRSIVKCRVPWSAPEGVAGGGGGPGGPTW